MYEYGDGFYAFLATFAVASAECVVPIVLEATGGRSIADFGCGHGAWLNVWQRAGLDVQGVDGPYVDQSKLLIDPMAFKAADLSLPINLGRRFDLVQSLETAEHLPKSSAATFVASLTAHSNYVLFSAAVPGQGGEHHINEQSPEFWRRIFRAHNFVAVDLIRPAVSRNRNVQIWYRCNTILYVKHDAVGSLSEQAQRLVVPERQTIANYWPLKERTQQAVIRHLPRPFVDWLAALNAKQHYAAQQKAAISL